MRKLTLPMILLCLVFLAAGASWADVITSCLAHPGPAFAPGMTPSKLGWGPNDKPYPDKFVVNPGDGSEMVWVPAGEFMMGRPDDTQGTGDERPVHKVRITKGFWLGKCTVTNGQYRAFCQATGGAFPEWSKNGPKHPVVCVMDRDAMAYCAQYGLTLPTEAQWEYAARGPQSLRYPWGNEWDPTKCCNCYHRGPGGWAEADDGHPPTMEVGSCPTGDSWCGASDMAGNVWQWCADWSGFGYYEKSPQDDPPGLSEGPMGHVMRGGSWVQNEVGCRSWRRGVFPPGGGAMAGFRVARTP